MKLTEPLIFVFILSLHILPAHADITLCKESTVIHEPRDDLMHSGDTSASSEVSPLQGMDPIMVPVTVDLIERYNLALPEGTQAETYLGMMEIYKDGTILYNGRDISGDIKDVCENGTSEFETE